LHGTEFGRCSIAVTVNCVPGTRDDLPPLRKLLDQAVQDALALEPQLLTMFGMDVGPHAAARSHLDDRSRAGLEPTRQLFLRLERDLAGYRDAPLSPSERIDFACGSFLTDTTLASYRFPYGDPGAGGAVPYVVSQLTGAYLNVPNFLVNTHPLRTREDAEAYLARLREFGRVLDQETERTREHYARGAMPPRFVVGVRSARSASR
jgi:uncharacterized protein (DUF885 family)